MVDKKFQDVGATEGFTTEHVTQTARFDARNNLSLDFDLLRIEALKDLQRQGFNVAALLEKIAGTIVNVNAKNLTEVLGVNIRASTGLGASIDSFRDRNVLLIKSLVGKQIDDVRDVMENAETTGLQVSEIRKQIQDQFGVSKSKADLIARDQTLKLNGQITQARQRLAGVNKYVWTTSGDERVREEHAALEGTIQSWDAPPAPGHPGEDYQCRCTAFPLIEEFDGPDAL